MRFFHFRSRPADFVVPASSLPRVLVISDRRQDASTHHKGQGERLVWLYL